jgi:acyl-coenzyme A synthetase/AMP-(fatty) acid ligase
MSSPAPRRASKPLPLIAHAPHAVLGWRRGKPVTAAGFLADVMRAAEALPDRRYILNFCGDRYRFAVALCAAIVRRQVTLMPPATTPVWLAAMREFAPDAYCVADDAASLDIPRIVLPEGGPAPATLEIPSIDADQVVACLFTSGSTGEPQPYYKRWGPLVEDVQAEGRRLDLGPGHAILGTVPPQHMYGFESTIMLPLASGAALTSERPYLPAEIDEALARVPSPRALFITPFHLRAWMEAADATAVETIVSATAPLSIGLARSTEERTGANLYEIYGCTETGQVATRRPTRGVEWEPLDGVRVWNDGAQAMAAGGHIEEPTRLNDVIEPLADGRFLLHGRTADMVNIAGKRSSLGYLNHQLTSVAGVQDGAFFVPDEEGDDGVTRLMAFVVAPGLTAAAIVKALRSRIDAAFLPRPLVVVDHLPRGLTGKLPRAALAALAAEARKRARGGR